MGRTATGTVLKTGGSYRVKLTVGPGTRKKTVALPWCNSERDADKRAADIAELIAKLRKAGYQDRVVDVAKLAGAAPPEALPNVRTLVGQIIKGERPPISQLTADRTTITTLAEQWFSGDLHKKYPDHVKSKSSSKDDKYRFDKYIKDPVGNVRVAEFTRAEAERVMARLPSHLSAASRRHVAQLLSRLLSMAVYPLGLLEQTPIPKGFLPRVTSMKAKSYLYPQEDRKLMGCKVIELPYRMLYGVLDREGMRLGEAVGLRWADFDLDRGVIRLDENKTDDPRAWALDPGVTQALAKWRKLRKDEPTSALVFVHPDGTPHSVRNDGLSALFRDVHVKQAGITRPELFLRSKSRLPLRVHDLRATFVTLSLANGKTESWVADRTGHRSSQMINTYRRDARTAAELALGPLLPLDQVIPEFKKRSGRAADGGDAPPKERAKNIVPISSSSKRRCSKTSVGQEGLEPSTDGLKVRSSTD